MQDKLEKALIWEKKKVDKAVQQLILARAEEIVNVQIDAAISGNLQAGQYLMDRTFGKARQNLGIDGGEDGAPIVFMPAVLIDKFNLNEPIPTHVLESDKEDPLVYKENV